MSFGSGISWSYTRHRQGFWPRINCSQMKLPYFESPSGDSLSKGANFGLSKWIFYVKNHPNLSKKKFIEEYQFRHTFFVKSGFCWLQFLNHFITKMTPNFWRTVTRWRPKIWQFHLTTVDSWPKPLPMPSAHSWNSTTETHLIESTKINLFRKLCCERTV